MTGVFLSYRRSDAGPEAGRLYDRLVQGIGHRNVYRDVDSTRHGADFDVAIRESIAQCEAMIVVIGPDWLGVGPGGRRIDDRDDWVRAEVEEALARHILVVPVLVRGATTGLWEQLPDALRDLSRRQAVILHEDTWNAQVDQLVRTVASGTDPPARWAAGPARIIVSAATLAVLTGLPGLLIGMFALPRSVAWAVVVAALVGALSTLAIAVVIQGARRSAWPRGATLGLTTAVGGTLNAVLGMVPFTSANVWLLYAFGFGLSAFSAMLATFSLVHIGLGTTLGVLSGLIISGLNDSVYGSSAAVVALSIAVYGALVGIAVAASPRPIVHWHR